MNRTVITIAVLILVLLLTGCQGLLSRTYPWNDSEKLADTTFTELVSAIEEKDSGRIVNLFSNTAKNTPELVGNAQSLIEFISGDVVSCSSAAEVGVGTNTEKDNGKVSKEILPIFRLETTTSTYYFAIKECVRDDFDDNRVGVLSLYVIDADNWPYEAVYRGDGNWTTGINIITETPIVD